MPSRSPVLLLLALPAVACAAPPASAAAPTLAQAQTAMNQLFDAAIADRPASDSSRLVAEAFRPRLQALSGCLPVTGTELPSVDCIVTAQAGPEPVHRLLRFSQVQGQWALQYAQREVPVPVPPQARVQVLLRESFAARATREGDAAARAALEHSQHSAEVVQVGPCALGDDAPVIECQVSARSGDEQGDLRMAFTWVDGQWQNATP